MHIVQQGSAPIVHTETVWYEGTVELQPGYVLCASHDEGLTPSAGEFDELQRGRVYVKPATANLAGPKRIVLNPPQKGVSGSGTSDYAGWCDVVIPTMSGQFTALVDGTTDIAVNDLLVPVNDQWHLAKSGTAPTTAQDWRLPVAKAREAYTTDSAANMDVYGINT